MVIDHVNTVRDKKMPHSSASQNVIKNVIFLLFRILIVSLQIIHQGTPPRWITKLTSTTARFNNDSFLKKVKFIEPFPLAQQSNTLLQNMLLVYNNW